MEKTFGVIGGDRRQSELARLLARDGHRVKIWNVEDPGELPPSSLEEALSADVIVLPLPLCREPGILSAGGERLETSCLFAKIPAGRIVLAGQVTRMQQQEAREAGVELTDYFAREELTVANAIPSAEGAIQVAMERLSVSLCGLPCLVIGWGRIGKLLAHRLAGLGAEVTVSARRCADRTWIRAFGWRALDTRALAGHLDRFGVVFNTVPAPVLSGPELAELPEDCLLVELASVPGIDLEAAKARGLDTVWARGLPGKLCPRTAAAAIRDTVYHILEERGESV